MGLTLHDEVELVGRDVHSAAGVASEVAPLAARLAETHNPVLDDEAFDDVELAERHVLVIDPGKTGLNLGEPVRISGTVRELDIAEAERLFDVDLDDRLFGPYERELVIFADEVTKLGGPSTTTRR